MFGSRFDRPSSFQERRHIPNGKEAGSRPPIPNAICAATVKRTIPAPRISHTLRTACYPLRWRHAHLSTDAVTNQTTVDPLPAVMRQAVETMHLNARRCAAARLGLGGGHSARRQPPAPFEANVDPQDHETPFGDARAAVIRKRARAPDSQPARACGGDCGNCRPPAGHSHAILTACKPSLVPRKGTEYCR